MNGNDIANAAARQIGNYIVVALAIGAVIGFVIAWCVR